MSLMSCTLTDLRKIPSVFSPRGGREEEWKKERKKERENRVSFFNMEMCPCRWVYFVKGSNKNLSTDVSMQMAKRCQTENIIDPAFN